MMFDCFYYDGYDAGVEFGATTEGWVGVGVGATT